MKDTGYFKGKKITVVGLARSGLFCAGLLSELGAKVLVTDNQDNDYTRANRSRLSTQGISVELGGHTQGSVEGADLLVVSPGVENKSLPVVWARERGIPVLSEIEIAWMLCPSTVIAVTGSNGKTTVTTLIGKVLEASGRRVSVCGNIGTPFCSVVRSLGAGDYVALEVSSFQLENIRTFKPRIAVILNLTPNHLDRYSSMEEYAEAKKRIFMNQDEADCLVLNAEDALLDKLAGQARAKTIFFRCAGSGLNPNQAAVLAVAGIVGIDSGVTRRVLADFRGIEHRLEYVDEIGGVTFVNDSKATTADSCLWALRNTAGPIVLIAGGRHKGIDYRMVRDEAARKVKRVVVIGEARQKIADAFSDLVPVEEAATLQEAVVQAFNRAQRGDRVLLSPMCSSFDMFSSYEERGRVFKEAVRALAEGRPRP